MLKFFLKKYSDHEKFFSRAMIFNVASTIVQQTILTEIYAFHQYTPSSKLSLKKDTLKLT